MFRVYRKSQRDEGFQNLMFQALRGCVKALSYGIKCPQDPSDGLVGTDNGFLGKVVTDKINNRQLLLSAITFSTGYLPTDNIPASQPH